MRHLCSSGWTSICGVRWLKWSRSLKICSPKLMPRRRNFSIEDFTLSVNTSGQRAEKKFTSLAETAKISLLNEKKTQISNKGDLMPYLSKQVLIRFCMFGTLCDDVKKGMGTIYSTVLSVFIACTVIFFFLSYHRFYSFFCGLIFVHSCSSSFEFDQQWLWWKYSKSMDINGTVEKQEKGDHLDCNVGLT